MRKKLVKSCLVTFIFSACLPLSSYGAVDWTLMKEVAVEGTPLDITASQDGKTMYILVPGKILMFSLSEKRVVDFVPVDKKVDKMSYSAKDNVFLLADTKNLSVQLFQMEKKARIDLTGLPFKGAESAPVTIAVYSDYQ